MERCLTAASFTTTGVSGLSGIFQLRNCVDYSCYPSVNILVVHDVLVARPCFSRVSDTVEPRLFEPVNGHSNSIINLIKKLQKFSSLFLLTSKLNQRWQNFTCRKLRVIDVYR